MNRIGEVNSTKRSIDVNDKMFKIEIIFSVINFIKMIKITEEIDLCVS